MNVRLHIERLVVDDGVLARGERAGIAEAIERELDRRLNGSQVRDDGRREAPPAHVQAIGTGILEHLPLAGADRQPRGGTAR